MYFAIEGIDGSGKSTLIRNLKKHFLKATFVREPGTSAFAEDIRNVAFKHIKDSDPIAVQLSLLAARVDLASKLKLEDFIISDRCFMSGSYCSDLNKEETIRDWLNTTLKFIKIPDLIIYLDITADESLNRLSNRDLFEGYDTLVKKEIEDRIESYNKWIKVAKDLSINIIRVNANKSIQEVTNEVYKIITQKLQEGGQCQMET